MARTASLVAAAFLGALALGGDPARAEIAPPNTPTYWSGEFAADPQAPLEGISCASVSLCVAYDSAGNVAWSTDPNGGEGAWAIAPVVGSQNATSGGISCTNVPLCVAVGSSQALVSSDPTGGSSAWSVESVDPGRTLTGISCVASPSLCVAVDNKGDVLTSTEPASGASSWKLAGVDGETELTGVSCSSSSLCVAIDAVGNVLSSTEPTKGSGAWTSAYVGVVARHISCITTPVCVATVGKQLIASGDPTGGAATWKSISLGDVGGDVSCALPSLCVALPGSSNSGIAASVNPAGGSQAWVAGDEAVGARWLTAVSCASNTLCVAPYGRNVLLGTSTNQLSASLAGAGKGRIESSPIACPWSSCASRTLPGIIEPAPLTELVCEDVIFLTAGPLCRFGFPPGDRVTLTARPAAGSVFAGWGSDCAGVGACALSMGTSHSVTAIFTPQVSGSAGPSGAPTIAEISSLHESNRAFLAAKASTPITGRAAKRLPRGTTFSLRLDQDATLQISIALVIPGRQVGGVCRPRRRALDRKPRCSREVTIATLRRAGHQGANTISFSGRIRGKALHPGSYEAAFRARDAAGSSRPQRLRFTVLRA